MFLYKNRNEKTFTQKQESVSRNDHPKQSGGISLIKEKSYYSPFSNIREGEEGREDTLYTSQIGYSPIQMQRMPEHETKKKFGLQSGFSYDDVRVHYNSEKFEQIQALTYTQNHCSHIVPEQERHLKQELGQKKQEQLPIAAYPNRVDINDNSETSYSEGAYQKQTIQMVSIARSRDSFIGKKFGNQGATNNLLSERMKINQYIFQLNMQIGKQTALQDIQRSRIKARTGQSSVPSIAILRQEAVGLANRYLDRGVSVSNNAEPILIVNALTQALKNIDEQLQPIQREITVTQIQNYKNQLHPDIYKLEITIENTGDMGDFLATRVAPIVEIVGNDVSRILSAGTVWRAGGEDANTLNEFNVLYSCPVTGIHMEVEYNESANSYARHSFIRDTDKPDQYREIISDGAGKRSGGNGINAYVGPEDILAQRPTTGNQPGVYQDQHGQNDYMGSSINEALNSNLDYAGDAVSIAGVELARFAFLRPFSACLTNDSYLIFSGFAVQLKELLSNYHNVCKAHYQRLNQTVPTKGWEYYGLNVYDVHRWLTNKTPIILTRDVQGAEKRKIFLMD